MNVLNVGSGAAPILINMDKFVACEAINASSCKVFFDDDDSAQACEVILGVGSDVVLTKINEL